MTHDELIELIGALKYDKKIQYFACAAWHNWTENGPQPSLVSDVKWRVAPDAEIQREIWVNIYPKGKGVPRVHHSRESADMFAGKFRAACARYVLASSEIL